MGNVERDESALQGAQVNCVVCNHFVIDGQRLVK